MTSPDGGASPASLPPLDPVPARAPVAATPPVRFGSAMVRRFGWFYRALGLGWAMERLRFEDHSVERIVKAERKGTLVYVLLRESRLDHLALNTVLNRRRLPLSSWSNGQPTFPWQPLWEAWRDVFARWRSWWQGGRAPDPVRSGWLARQVADGMTVAVFLGDDDASPAADPLTALLDAAAQSAQPIQLVPIICVWDPSPDVGNDVLRFLLGSRERPTLLTRLANLYFPSSRPPFVQAGEPLDLSEFMRRTDDSDRRRRLRVLLRRYLKRESKVVRGPSLLPFHEMKQIVLDNPPMRQFAEEEAKATGTTVAAVQTALSKEYDQIAANFSWGWVRFLSIAMKPIWNRVFSGYDIRDEDLDRIRAASRLGAPVLVPCHKSHFDYLLLAWICFYADIVVPHVVAGINLAIWPVSIILRAAGGFFVKRSFIGERLHPKVFARYLRELLRHGYTVEFFIEGGRTRTGMLLPPKLGVLGMVVESAWRNAAPAGRTEAGKQAPRDQEVTLLPVAITYEQVAEEGAYRQELGGAEKQKESMGQLIEARSVLTRRFGRVYVRVGEPIRCSAVLAQVDDWGALDEEARRKLLQSVGDLLVHRIGQVMVVLPTSVVALGLLAHPHRGMTHDDLMSRIERFRAWLHRMNALESDSLARGDTAIANALDRFEAEGLVKGHALDGKRVWRITPEYRISLDFHKNQVLHFFAPAAHAAAAITLRGAAAFTPAELAEDWRFLVEMLDREFTFDPLVPSEAVLDRALGALVEHRALQFDDGVYTVVDLSRLDEVLGLLRGLLESYLLVATAAVRQSAPVIEAKAFLKEISNGAEAWIATGVVSRPEALNAVALKNALTNFGEMGFLPVESKGHHRVERARLQELTDRLARATFDPALRLAQPG